MRCHTREHRGKAYSFAIEGCSDDSLLRRIYRSRLCLYCIARGFGRGTRTPCRVGVAMPYANRYRAARFRRHQRYVAYGATTERDGCQSRDGATRNFELQAKLKGFYHRKQRVSPTSRLGSLFLWSVLYNPNLLERL